ncbi:MAG: nucleotidyltransferase family protein [Deltaproteobacteria bacterium]|nr:nucleotidyltransferase family protein [Deltaproteobacteria bacterium]
MKAPKAGSLDRRKIWATQMQAGRMVRRVAEALAPHVRVMPVKGVLLGRTFYDDLADRTLSDCDVVVVGASARDAAAMLVDRGFRVVRWSNDPNVVDLRHPDLPGMYLDVHARPLPVGFGPVTSAWLAEGAREDATLFAAPVLIPDDRRLLVHLLGNIQRDHVFRAHAHTAEDVARVLARSPYAIDAFAEVIGEARLRVGSWSALRWVEARTGSDRAAALCEALRLSAGERRWARARESVMRPAASVAPAPLLSRVVARCVSASPGPCAAATSGRHGGARWSR